MTKKYRLKKEKEFSFVFIPKISEEYSLEKFKENMEYLLKKGGIIGKC